MGRPLRSRCLHGRVPRGVLCPAVVLLRSVFLLLLRVLDDRQAREPAATRPVAASVLPRLRAGPVPEEKDRRGEPVDEVASRDRTELARREKSSDRNVAERALHRTDVVVGLTEQSLTAAIARKQ